MDSNQHSPSPHEPPNQDWYNDGKLDVELCLDEAWQAFKARPGLAIGGYAVFFLIYLPILFFMFRDLVVLQYVWQILVLMPASAGLAFFFLNLAGAGQPAIGDIFEGFSRFWIVLGIYLLMVLGAAVIMIPWFLVWLLLMLGSSVDPVGNFVIFLSSLLVFMLVLLWLGIRFSFLYFVIWDEPRRGVIDCFKRSWQITRGNTGRLVLLVLLALLVMIAGVLLLVVGLFAALPIVGLMTARAYLWLKSFHPEPVETTVPAPDGSV